MINLHDTNGHINLPCTVHIYTILQIKYNVGLILKKDWRLVFAKYKENDITYSLFMHATYEGNFWMMKIISQFLIEIYNKRLVTKEHISEFVNWRSETGLSAYHYWCFPKPKKSTLYLITEIPQLDFSIPVGAGDCKHSFRPYKSGWLGSDLYKVYQSRDACMEKLLQWESKGIVKFLPQRK